MNIVHKVCDAALSPIEEMYTLLKLALYQNDIKKIENLCSLIIFKRSITEDEISHYLLNDEVLPSMYMKFIIAFDKNAVHNNIFFEMNKLLNNKN